MLRPKNMKLGEMLKEAGLIDDFQLNSALSYQRNCGGRLGSALIALKYISEDTLLDFLAEQLKLVRIDLTQRRVPEDVLRLLPEQKARQYNVIPVARKESGGATYLLVALSDPTNLSLLDDLQGLTGCRIRPALDTEASIRDAISKYYSALSDDEENALAEALDSIIKSKPKPAGGDGLSRLDKLIDLLAGKGILSAEEVRRLK